MKRPTFFARTCAIRSGRRSNSLECLQLLRNDPAPANLLAQLQRKEQNGPPGGCDMVPI